MFFDGETREKEGWNAWGMCCEVSDSEWKFSVSLFGARIEKDFCGFCLAAKTLVRKLLNSRLDELQNLSFDDMLTHVHSRL